MTGSGIPNPGQRITIISGGQTGADRAALDFAMEHGIPHGGWCPRGRLAEDGAIPPRYQLQETPSPKYSQRTEWNIRDSDATVIFTVAPYAEGGTLLTVELAQRLEKPWLYMPRDATVATVGGATADSGGTRPILSLADQAARLRAFLARHKVRRLNIAGPRASQEPEIAVFVHGVLEAALRG